MAKELQQIPQYILTCLFQGALVIPSPFSQHLGCANHSTCYVLMVSASSRHATWLCIKQWIGSCYTDSHSGLILRVAPQNVPYVGCSSCTGDIHIVKHFRRRHSKSLSLLQKHPGSQLLCWSHLFLKVCDRWKSLDTRGNTIANESIRHSFIGWKGKSLPPTSMQI